MPSAATDDGERQEDVDDAEHDVERRRLALDEAVGSEDRRVGHQRGHLLQTVDGGRRRRGDHHHLPNHRLDVRQSGNGLGQADRFVEQLVAGVDARHLERPGAAHRTHRERVAERELLVGRERCGDGEVPGVGRPDARCELSVDHPSPISSGSPSVSPRRSLRSRSSPRGAVGRSAAGRATLMRTNRIGTAAATPSVFTMASIVAASNGAIPPASTTRSARIELRNAPSEGGANRLTEDGCERHEGDTDHQRRGRRCRPAGVTDGVAAARTVVVRPMIESGAPSAAITGPASARARTVTPGRNQEPAHSDARRPRCELRGTCRQVPSGRCRPRR